MVSMKKSLLLLTILMLCGPVLAVYNPNDPTQTVLGPGQLILETNSVFPGGLLSWANEDSRSVDNQGLDPNGMKHYQHEYGNYMWLSNAFAWNATDSANLTITLPGNYELESLLIWNHGQDFNEGTKKRGFRWVTIEYSQDKMTWTTYGDVELTNAPDRADAFPYSYTDDVDFSGITARYIRITGFTPSQGGTFETVAGSTVYYGLAHITVVYTGVAPEPPFMPTQDALTRDQVTPTSSGDVSTNPLAGSVLAATTHTGIVDAPNFIHEGNAYGGGMWVSIAGGGGLGNPHPGTRTGSAWVKFDLGGIRNLGVMHIWNCRQDGSLGRNLKKVYVEYTTDGSTWTTLMNGSDDFFILNPASGQNGPPENAIDFGGAAAKAVVITAAQTDGNYGDPSYYCLSEIRFGLEGTNWPPDPNYPRQDLVPHTSINVSQSNATGGEAFWTVDNTGLGGNFRHIADAFGAAMSGNFALTNTAAVPGSTTSGKAWWKFDFDQAYSLGIMRIWNQNQIGYGFPWDNTDRGVRSVSVQYTSNGTTWNTLGTFEVPRAVAEDQAAPDIDIDFGGVTATSVVITALNTNGNWGHVGKITDPGDDVYGLSQVEFGIAGTSFGYGETELKSFVSDWLNIGIVNDVCVGTPQWDLNGNCGVDFDDYLIFADRWLFDMQ